ncbi:FHA domain-containing protein [bacterium]|nr:FHA domain-containing protein [bacterium]
MNQDGQIGRWQDKAAFSLVLNASAFGQGTTLRKPVTAPRGLHPMVLKHPPIHSTRQVEATITLEVTGTKQSFRLLNPTRIGRSSESHIRLGGSAIQPRHAVIAFADGRWSVQAETPSGAIEVNGKSTRSSVLSEGDVIAIGGVMINFHLGPFQVPPSLSNLPHDPTDPRRAVITELAKRQTQIDLARAEFEADRETWLSRLAAEKKQIEERRVAAEERVFSAERALTAQRLRFESEWTQARIDINTRQKELDGEQRDLAESLRRLSIDRETIVRFRREAEKTRQTEEEANRRSLRSTARLIQKLQRDQSELDRRAESVKNEESRLEQTRSRIERQLEIRAHELAGLTRRIDNERILLSDLQRRRASGENPRPTSTEISTSAPMAVEVAQLEQLARHIEKMTAEIEESASQVEIGNRRIAEERRRLVHFARHLKQRQKELDECEQKTITPRLEEIERREREVTDHEGKLAVTKQIFESERAAWLVERAAWEETKLSDQAALRDEWNRLNQKRSHLVLHHRRRMERFRRDREEVRQDRRRVLSRIGDLMRREARLEILRQEISAMELVRSEEDLRRSAQSDPFNPRFADERETLLQRRRQNEQRWVNLESRISESLESIEREIIAGRSLSSMGANPSKDDELDQLKTTLAAMKLDQTHRAKSWEEERRQYQRELEKLRGELESIAVSYLEPNLGQAA